MKYRVTYNKPMLTVVDVIEDDSNTITSMPDDDIYCTVEDDLEGVKDALIFCNYDVTVLQDFIDNLP